MCRIPNPEFDNELKHYCKVCVSPLEKPNRTTGKKPQSSSGGTVGRLGKNGHEDEGGRQKGDSAKRKFLAFRENGHGLALMNKKLKTAEVSKRTVIPL